ncbi:26S proteasome non-ATPase regulatory subunit 12 [Boothiomyces macroporosus]|uniref:26S proteasome non-ATPase regulatory subunit 12 n=1 Tax=Boothiomyces macroporosus TaxID=261099 RepID=A0AAD5Y8E8_9FUNG|nr:26S proteasome non-ATPase regulatory subunit 12 [Boothiomyces macroporosus]
MSQPAEKMEKDWSVEAAEVIAKSTALAKVNTNLGQAIEQLSLIEKQTRTSADLASNTKVLLAIVELTYQAKDYKLLNENIVLLTKKRALLKQAVTTMIQKVMTFVDEITDMKIKLELIDTLRTVTDGKIFVEVERARLTRTLVKFKEAEGKIVEAADLLQELQVETYGSMEKREKTDFILEQFRLCLAKKDYTRAQIISRKISIKFFEDKEYHDLKVRFYKLMIVHSLHGNEYLKTCKNYRSLYDTPLVKEDEKQWKEALANIVFFIVLSPFDHEQSDLIHRIYQDPNLKKLALHRELLKCFITNELMRWPKIEEVYGPTLKATTVFTQASEEGKKRYQDLHKRVIEHDAENFLSDLVVKKTIYARVDRISGIVTFEKKKDANTVLNEWSSTIHSLLDLIVKTNHLIMKEEMVHTITKQITE